jgi:hypothetical protein
VNLHLGEVLNKNAAQCRFVLAAAQQAPAFALGTAGLAAETSVATPALGYLPSNRSTGSLRYAANGHLQAN